MRTILVQAQVLAEQEGTLLVRLQDGLGEYVHRIAAEKAVSIERLEGEKKPDHRRQPRRKKS